MGLTVSDLHKRMYTKWRAEGLSHEQCLGRIPESVRDQFEKDINKTYIESHYGMNYNDVLYLMLGISLVLFFVALVYEYLW